MKFELDSARHGYVISGYGKGFVSVGDRRYSGALLVTPTELRTDGLPAAFDDLDLTSLLELAPTAIDILVLGCGPLQRFLNPAVIRALGERGIGAEVMTTPAACRSYNVLVAEQRAVAALIYVT